MYLGRRDEEDEKPAQLLITLPLICNHCLRAYFKKYRFIIYFNRVDVLAFFSYKKLCKVLLSILKLERNHYSGTSKGNVTLLVLAYCYFIDKKYQVLIKLIK